MATPEITTRRTTEEELVTLAEQGFLFAIVDACNQNSVVAKMEELGKDRAICLLRGRPDPEYLAVAPFLVAVDHAVLTWLHDTLWAEHWGVFVVTRDGMRGIRENLRQYLLVQNAQDQTVYFRFYDPRVLEPFLSSCDRAELEGFYGPAMAFGIADQERFEVELLRMK